MSHFANGLKQLRLEHNLTQAALAKDLNVTQNAIFNWENEKREPNLNMIEKIADYFDTSLLYLLEGKKEYKRKHDIVAEQLNEILTSYNSLNDSGKEEARKRVNELTEIPRYTNLLEPP